MVKDSLNSAEEARKIARIEYKYQLDQETLELEAAQLKKDLAYEQELEEQKWLRNASIGGVLAFLMIALVIYRSYQVKKRDNQQLAYQANMLEYKNEELQVLREKEQEMMEKEREYMEENISNKERQLATITMLSHEKNSLLNQLLAQVREVKEQVGNDAIAGLKAAEKLIQKNLNMKNSWESFVYQFENVHPNFFKNIREHHPSITPTELKTSAYIKIGFANKEIAHVSNMAPTTVKKNVSRLKKRLGLGPEDDVRDYIMRL